MSRIAIAGYRADSSLVAKVGPALLFGYLFLSDFLNNGSHTMQQTLKPPLKPTLKHAMQQTVRRKKYQTAQQHDERKKSRD